MVALSCSGFKSLGRTLRFFGWEGHSNPGWARSGEAENESKEAVTNRARRIPRGERGMDATPLRLLRLNVRQLRLSEGWRAAARFPLAPSLPRPGGSGPGPIPPAGRDSGALRGEGRPTAGRCRSRSASPETIREWAEPGQVPQGLRHLRDPV